MFRKLFISFKVIYCTKRVRGNHALCHNYINHLLLKQAFTMFSIFEDNKKVITF